MTQGVQPIVENNDREVRNWGMLCHLSSLLWIPLFLGGLLFPFAHILAPLIVWLLKRKEHPFIDRQGKESVNFQISFSLYLSVIGAVILLASWIAERMTRMVIDQNIYIVVGLLVFFLVLSLVILAGIAHLTLVIFASVKANQGDFYRYPFTIRFLK